MTLLLFRLILLLIRPTLPRPAREQRAATMHYHPGAPARPRARRARR